MYKVEKDYLFVAHIGNLRKGDVITKEQADTYRNFQVLIDEGQVSFCDDVKLSKKEQKKADKKDNETEKDAREFVSDDDEL